MESVYIYIYILRPRESPNSRVSGRTLVLRRHRARWQARAREARVFSCARFRRRLGCVFGSDFVCVLVRRGEQNVHTRSPNAYIGDRDITARRNHRRHHRRDLDGAREQKGQERSKCGRAPEQGTEQNPRGARSRAAPECARFRRRLGCVFGRHFVCRSDRRTRATCSSLGSPC